MDHNVKVDFRKTQSADVVTRSTCRCYDGGLEQYRLMNDLYKWVDIVPFQRKGKNIARDFSDATMCAELLHHFFPGMVELHNYPRVSSTEKKVVNWDVLNRKVLRKINCAVSQPLLKDIVRSVDGAIEKFLLKLKPIVEEKKRQENVRRTVNYIMGQLGAGNPSGTAPKSANDTGTKPIPNYKLALEMLTGAYHDQFEELIKAKNERDVEIETLRNKVGQMDKQLKQKDERVEMLTKQLECLKKLTVKSPRSVPACSCLKKKLSTKI